jgi:hypothetical protein
MLTLIAGRAAKQKRSFFDEQDRLELISKHGGPIEKLNSCIERLYNLSDSQTQYQILDRLSFQRFLGKGLY